MAEKLNAERCHQTASAGKGGTSKCLLGGWRGARALSAQGAVGTAPARAGRERAPAREPVRAGAALGRGRARPRPERFPALGRAPAGLGRAPGGGDGGHLNPRRDPTPRRPRPQVGRPAARPFAPGAGGAGPRRAMAERSGPRAPRTGRSGAGGR